MAWFASLCDLVRSTYQRSLTFAGAKPELPISLGLLVVHIRLDLYLGESSYLLLFFGLSFPDIFHNDPYDIGDRNIYSLLVARRSTRFLLFF